MKQQTGILFFILLTFAQTLNAQFKYDNKLFKNIYLEDLPDALRQSPGALLLDVRSPGEFSDTSQSMGYNIGRLKNAKNITVKELGKRLSELKEYKNKPIFVYCSHSQRSRVSCKMLADSGFTNVQNINGGMTHLNLLKNTSSLLNDLYETSNSFKLVSPSDAGLLMQNNNDVLVLDIRSDSIFKGIARETRLNAFGKIKNAVNIPLIELNGKLSKIPTDKQILIVDNFGDQSIVAAKLLLSKGFTRVNVLFNGMGFWISENDPDNRNKFWNAKNNFTIITTKDFGNRMQKNPLPFILDIRSKQEFTNSDTVLKYRNKGHIQNAINIPSTDLQNKLNTLSKYKNDEVIVYAFSDSPEAYEAAKLLSMNGFINVKVMAGGIWSVLWKAANIKGLDNLKELVVEVPETK